MKGRKYCKICKSPYRDEIEELQKKAIPMTDIARKYHSLFSVSVENFYATLNTHINKKHPPVFRSDPLPIEERKHISFDEYADMLLQEGAQSIISAPSKVSHSHVIGAKRAQLEEAKVKNQISASQLMFLKFFRGSIEGEIVNDEPTGEKALPADTDR
jgi:hypothetical protein